MTRQLVLRPDAESDIAGAAQWYDEQRPGLSLDFRSALDRTFSAIESRPEQFARVYREFRRALLRRFPYGVFYVRRGEDIVVIAVFHTSRHPRLWRARVKREG